jgi:hypothetical protein
MDQVTVPRATLQQALHVATAAAYPVALIAALRAALEQPKPPPEAQTEAERLAYCAGWWAAMEQKREQPAQEPVACFIGAKGSAFDLPTTKRAYTYAEQPGNVAASKLGRSLETAKRCSAGDGIDAGLVLLKALQSEGFGVFQLGAEYTHPPRRDPLTVTDLQQALVDADLVDPDAIDDPEGFDNGFTLQQIDALHSRLMQTTPPTTTTQPEPK